MNWTEIPELDLVGDWSEVIARVEVVGFGFRELAYVVGQKDGKLFGNFQAVKREDGLYVPNHRMPPLGALFGKNPQEPVCLDGVCDFFDLANTDEEKELLVISSPFLRGCEYLVTVAEVFREGGVSDLVYLAGISEHDNDYPHWSDKPSFPNSCRLYRAVVAKETGLSADGFWVKPYVLDSLLDFQFVNRVGKFVPKEEVDLC